LEKTVAEQVGAKRGNNVLVVDDEALRIINACMPSSDLVKSGFICR